jgi:hypothetical protein
MSTGQFTQLTQSWAFTDGPEERREIEVVREAARKTLGPGDVQWSGAIAKRTAIIGSDLDIWVDTPSRPVTAADRRAFHDALRAHFPGRTVTVQSHVVRVAASATRPRVDISFGNALFGGRPRPVVSAFRDRPDRQEAARAMKIWLRRPGMPKVRGWVVEAFVLGADHSPTRKSGLELFLKLTRWLAESANPSAVESVLRPNTSPWAADWSARLPGPLEAIRNEARRLLSRDLASRPLLSVTDAEAWLRGQ